MQSTGKLWNSCGLYDGENGISTNQEIQNALKEVGVQYLREPRAEYEHKRSKDSSQNRTS